MKETVYLVRTKCLNLPTKLYSCVLILFQFRSLCDCISASVMAMDQVELQEYQGKWLTEAEIQLSMFFEVKHEDKANELRAKKMERDIMAKRSLTVQQQQQLV